jgi:hypothetical protein
MRAIAVLALLLPAPRTAATIRVPEDRPTVQAAVDAARDGDTVLVSPGLYRECVTVRKSVTIASRFLETKDPSDVERTVIEGKGKPVITVPKGSDVRVLGLTLRNGEDGILCDGGRIEALHNRMISNGEGVSFEGGRGIVRANLLEGSGDDGVDCDGATDALIEDNVIRNNRDDGVEVRLHAYTGPRLSIVIRNNFFSGNREDGVQLIDYPGLSDRLIRIEGNVIHLTAMAGVGCMPDGETRENYRGAPLKEPVWVLGNTFVDNAYGLTGADNMLVANNIFVGTKHVAVRRLQGESAAGPNLFWRNGADFEGADPVRGGALVADPLLDKDYRLREGSPAIDAGAASLEHRGVKALDLAPPAYAGKAPDLGAFERK